MSNLEEAKKKYDAIPIPEELSDSVNEAVARSAEKRERRENLISLKQRSIFWNSGAKAAAAAVVVCTIGFTTALNTSVAFAEMASQLPVIGPVAQVLTFRSYEKTEDDINIKVDIPSIEMIAACPLHSITATHIPLAT